MLATLPEDSANLLATFQLRHALCGLNASAVHEVIRYQAPTPIRHAPPQILGVINLRGKIVTLFDLGLMLGFAPLHVTPDSRIFIVDDRGEFIGLVADRVEGVVEAERSDAGPLPANIPHAQARFFTHAYRNAGRTIAALDAREILAEGRP